MGEAACFGVVESRKLSVQVLVTVGVGGEGVYVGVCGIRYFLASLIIVLVKYVRELACTGLKYNLTYRNLQEPRKDFNKRMV